ncbi:MAG: NUDIX hydrolase [Pseudomonadota bacterium]
MKTDPKRETIKQISSGGVVFRRIDGRTEIALIATKGGRVWGLPKGAVEAGEDLTRAAYREVREETGLTGRILKKIDSIKYWYSRKDGERTKRFFKVVYFFLMECIGGDITAHDDEVDEVVWYRIEDAPDKVTYPGERGIVVKAKEMLQSEAFRKE